LTYDARDEIPKSLYKDSRIAEFDIAHTAQVQHVGLEYAVFSPNLVVPGLGLVGGREGRWVAA
jgi:DNA adenine methylase